MYSQCFSSPVGDITVRSDGEYITEASFGNFADAKPDNLTEKAVSELLEYFEGVRHSFDFPIKPDGTAFQLKVWGELCNVKYGETASYKDVAEAIGCKCCRAIGGANKKNPIAIVIPCHRIIASDGTIGGYASGTDKKRFLLDLENKNK